MTKKVNILTDPATHALTVSEAVACKLKAYRKMQKLSLDEFARHSGVSKGMLVEIEKGSANPSIGILCKIAATLGVSVADMVNVVSNPTVHLLDKKDIPVLWNGPKGGNACLLAGTSGANMIELWRWVMQPGETFNSSGHPSGTYELLHVEEGELHLSIDETDWTILQGCSVVARTDVPHQYANQSAGELVFTMTVAELHS